MELIGPVVATIAVALAILLLIQALVSVTTVREWERGLEYASGRFVRTVGPGAHTRLRFRSRIVRVDMRPSYAVVPGQEILTTDGVPVKVSLVAQYAVVDPVAATHETADHIEAIHVQLQIAAREVIGGQPVDDVLSGRSGIGEAIAQRAAPELEPIGIALRGLSVRDLMLSGELKKTFAQVVQARQEGLAALERARGETSALRNLANAAKLVEGNPALYQLRLLQTLASQEGSTIVLGPVDPGSVRGATPPAPTPRATRARKPRASG